jgi:hypothetical protein
MFEDLSIYFPTSVGFVCETKPQVSINFLTYVTFCGG